MIRDLIFEQYKNFKLIFRNLSSLMLLVIGPLALILLIGFAYSGEGVHDINIGVIAFDYEILEPAFANFSSYAEIQRYDSSVECISGIKKRHTHICLEFSRGFGQVSEDSIPSGTLTFYFDNSQKSLSNKLVESISGFFGLEAEKISIESAETIFSNIQDMVVYLYDKNEDINVLVNESGNIRQDLLERQARLIEVRDEFMPVYTEIKELQSGIDNVTLRLDRAYEANENITRSLIKEIDELEDSIRSLDPYISLDEFYLYNTSLGYEITSNLTYVLENNLTYLNLSSQDYFFRNNSLVISGFINGTDISFPEDIFDEEEKAGLITSLVLVSLDSFESSLINASGSGTEYYLTIKEQKQVFDSSVMLLDNLKLLLDTDIASTQEYVDKIDAAVINMKQIQDEMNSNLEDLKQLDPSIAETLVRPISQNYEPLIPGLENIKVAFPGMMAIIIIFISILFANIVTLSEINSKAFYRNLISPVNKMVFVIGLMITNLVVVLFQVLVLILVAQFSFRIDIASYIFPVMAVIALLSLIFISIGMIFAVLLREEQTSILTTTFAALAFFMFSDSVTPLEAMPPLATAIASYNPFVIASSAFRKILVFGMTDLSSEYILLSAYLATSLLLLFLLSWKKLNEK